MKERPEIFRRHGGQLRMSEAIERGITRYMLYSLRDKGVVEQVEVSIGYWNCLRSAIPIW